MDKSESGSRPITDPAVLTELVRRLGNVEPRRTSSDPDHVCVTDVAEALGVTSAEVSRELDRIQDERHRERVSVALREIEEPLYRVERPGHGPTVAHQDPLMRIRTVRDLSARHTETSQPNKPVERKSPDRATKISAFFANVILLLVVGSVVTILATFMASTFHWNR